jgi:hypothetical protein
VPGKITSTLTNALRQAAKQNQTPDPDKQGILGKLFGDIGTIGGLFGLL